MLSGPEDGPSDEVLAPFDGLVLIGGGDVHPNRYGARAHPEQYGVDEDRDSLEVALVHDAILAGLPTIGICRGAQVVNIALGGTLHQHLPDIPGLDSHGVPAGGDPAIHEVKVAESSRLFAACRRTTLVASSAHHQGLARLGDGLVPVAWSGDGLVEAVEHERGWLVAVQWHPEETAHSDPSQQALFDAFAEQAGRWASAGPAGERS
jgi:putative glutamine amidotransferase